MPRVATNYKTRRLLESILPAYLDMPFEKVTLKVLSQMSGLNRSALYRRASREELFRDCILLLMSDIAETISQIPVATGISVQGTIGEFAAALAAEFSTERYRKVLYIVVRDRHERPWLAEGYRHCILNPAYSRVRNLIAIAGQRQGIALRIPLENVQHFVARLESIFAMAALAPGHVTLSDREKAAHIRAVVQEAAGNAYCFEEMLGGNFVRAADRETRTIASMPAQL